jgi:hypothetical protein
MVIIVRVRFPSLSPSHEGQEEQDRAELERVERLRGANRVWMFGAGVIVLRTALARPLAR